MTLRIGIDYRPALLQSAGIGRSVRELCRQFGHSEPDLEVQLFGHSFARAHRQLQPRPGGHLHRLPIPGRSLPLLAGIGLDAARLCGGVELFHWTDYIHPPVSNARTVLTIHDLAMLADAGFHGAATELMLDRCRSAAQQSDAVVCPTEASAGQVIEHFGLARERLEVIPFGCDHLGVASPRRPLTESYLVMVGTIEPRKNHLKLLRAYSDLPTPRPRLLVLGRRGWQCDAEVEALQSTAGVTWIEQASDAELVNYVAHAELLVYPSLLEGFGFPPLEAMRLGTPVLAGDTPALREVLADAAEFCDPNDVDDIRDRLAKLCQERELRDTLQQRGEIQAAGFSWRRCAERHAALYRRVTGARR